MNGDTAETLFLTMVGGFAEENPGVGDVMRASVPASAFDRDWQIAVNSSLYDENEVEGFPVEERNFTLQERQAFVFLGERHAGIVSMDGREFYTVDGVGEEEIGERFVRDVRDYFLESE